MNYKGMSTPYSNIFERFRKTSIYIVVTILCVSVLVAIGQSIRFSSSLWVVTEFGFIYWEEHITRMLDKLVMWAIVAGIMFVAEAFINSTTTEARKILLGTAISFVVGFACTYLFVVIVGITLYIPLGILSFIFPDKIYFASMGFAFLCSTYIVFGLIAVDTPRILIEVIKKAPLYFKILGVLFAILLASQMLSTIISILLILMKHSIWRVHLSAFVIAFGVTLIITIVINLIILKKEASHKKVAIIASVFVLSIITGNISESIFHWGEYASAIVAAIFGPIAYSFLLYLIQRNIVSALSVVIGVIGGLGTGLFIANYTGLRIVGQDWFGMICGSIIALGFGISFGFMLAPRITELIVRVFGLKPTIGMGVSIGFFIGVIIGIVTGGFVNR